MSLVSGLIDPKHGFITERDTIKKIKYGEQIKSSVLDMLHSKFRSNRHSIQVEISRRQFYIPLGSPY